MSQIPGRYKFYYVLETVIDSDLGTFKASEVNEHLDFNTTDRRLIRSFDDESESSVLHKVGEKPNIYSIYSYQTNEAADDLELLERKALDELVQNVLNRDKTTQEEARQSIQPYFAEMQIPNRLPREKKVLDAAKSLGIVEYNSREKQYRPKT